jgi:ribose transport system ATP-binding protein
MPEQAVAVNGEELIRLEHISKHFGGVKALNDVSFSIRPGEVHALVGENGAGKSTLMKLLAGVHEQDEGRVFIEGKEVRISTPRIAESHGIAMVFQELSLFVPLTVQANIFIGQEATQAGFLLDERRMNMNAREALERLMLDIDPSLKVAELRHSQRQIVEIARAVAKGTKVVIMDEPNSALNDEETKALFQVIRKLKSEGVTIIYVSHRLEEVFAISDRISVLRDGHYIGSWNTAETTIDEIVTNVVGRRLGDVFPERTQPINNQVVLSVKGLKLNEDAEPIQFQIKRGEIVGLAGLEGSGVQDVINALFGLKQYKGDWSIEFKGERLTNLRPAQLIQKKWALIPAERRAHGLMLNWSLLQNVSLVIIERLATRLGLIKHKQERSLAQKYISDFSVATDSYEKAVGQLSGGNQQKVVVAKWMATNPEFLILNDPTRGIDVGTKREIYRLVSEWAKQGYTILVTSSEIEEVIGMAHRILVFYKGGLIREFQGAQTDKEEVMRYVLSGEATEVSLAAD